MQPDGPWGGSVSSGSITPFLNAERVAVANEVAIDARFDARRAVKLALPGGSYTPRGR
jgi:hypothetical protein